MKEKCILCGRKIEQYFMNEIYPANYNRFVKSVVQKAIKIRMRGRKAYLCDTCISN